MAKAVLGRSPCAGSIGAIVVVGHCGEGRGVRCGMGETDRPFIYLGQGGVAHLKLECPRGPLEIGFAVLTSREAFSSGRLCQHPLGFQRCGQFQ